MTECGKAPNPGSDEALALGCHCPVMDNNRGLHAPRPPDGWWINWECPVHTTNGARSTRTIRNTVPRPR
jgi:hypothetical protein